MKTIIKTINSKTLALALCAVVASCRAYEKGSSDVEQQNRLDFEKYRKDKREGETS